LFLEATHLSFCRTSDKNWGHTLLQLLSEVILQLGTLVASKNQTLTLDEIIQP
jgi:hypothetical protein